MPQNKVSRPKREITMPRKKTLICEKKKLQEKHILSSVFLNLTKLGMFFQKQGFNFLNEKNKQTCPTLTSQMGRTMKRFVLKQGEAWLKREDFT